MSAYDERPWLALYDDDRPHDIEPEHATALEMFRASLARAGDRPLIHYFDATLTLAEVDRLSDGLAAALAERGVERGDRVGVYLQNVPQFPIAVLAAWKAGATVLPLNPMLRGRELELLLTDSEAAALVCHESLHEQVAREVVPRTSVRAVITTSELDFLDRADGGAMPEPLKGIERHRPADTDDLLELAGAHADKPPPDPALGPDDVAFLTYTSGTTGPPKGAMNSHRNVVFTARVFRDWIGLDERDVVFGVAPLFHITGLIGHLAVSLLVPMPLVLRYRFTPADALDAIEGHRCTFAIGSITVYTALMNQPGVEERDLGSLTKVASGGAPIAPATVEAFERLTGAYVHNMYGLTETTSPSHGVPWSRRAPVDPASGALSVGTPVFNTVVRVIDEQGNDLPPGEVGELATRGPQVVSGYWRKPEETEHALPGGELRTGDVGFMDSEGWFYVVDRRKDQINVSGYKVWPREVEDALMAHPAVREAAVIGVPDAYRGETVKAFVALKPGAKTDADELIGFCRERMAAYKYPRALELVDELPKTPTGKILRRELRDAELARAGR